MGESAPVFDYTSGTPWVHTKELTAELEAAQARGESVADAWSRADVDLLRNDDEYAEQFRDRFRRAGVDVISVTLGSRINPDLPYSERVMRDLARWQARFDSRDWLCKVTTPSEARAIAGSDDVGIVLNTQNLGRAIDADLDRIEDLYDAGVRIMQLTYNRQNLLGTGCTDYSAGGLSALGREAVERIESADAVPDLSHCNRKTTLDTLKHADGPVAFTHVSCGALADHQRAKSDEELELLREVDGYVGIVAIPTFLAPQEDAPSFDVFFDHIDHAISIVGIERVGIGTDFPNLDADIPDQLIPEIKERAADNLWRKEHRATAGLADGFGRFERYEDWQHIRQGLAERYDADEVEGILGRNFLAFWERVTG